MASFVVAGTRLEYEAKVKSGTSLGKPVHARVVRRFSLGEVAPEAAVAAAATASKEAGWDPRSEHARSFSASKQIDDIRAELRVTIDQHRGADALFLYLTAF